jgi:uncharacterized oligopeptide transporter (OPT) family protein
LTLFLLAGIVAIACGLAGDILNDFKSGYKLKTDPKQQFIGELIGAVVSSFVISFLFFVFFNVYKNIGPQATNPQLIVLQASIVASVVHGIPFIKTSDKFLLLSNGLMAGEAIVGVIISILAYIHLFN